MSRFPNMATVKNADRNDPAPKIAINHWILQFHTHVRVCSWDQKKMSWPWIEYHYKNLIQAVFRLKSVGNKYFICEIKDVSAIDQAHKHELFEFGRQILPITIFVLISF